MKNLWARYGGINRNVTSQVQVNYTKKRSDTEGSGSQNISLHRTLIWNKLILKSYKFFLFKLNNVSRIYLNLILKVQFKNA